MADEKKMKMPWEEKFQEPTSKEEAKKMVQDLIDEAQKYASMFPKEIMDIHADRLESFLNGDMSWADILGMPHDWRKAVAEAGYSMFKVGKYRDAERFFKVLSVLDWENPYYHTMMGQIMQRQKAYVEAVVHYNFALKKDPNNIICLTSRGECYMITHVYKEAREDFEKASSLTDEKDEWGKRARSLHEHLVKVMKGKVPVKKVTSKKKG